jgi:hypothetical protein
MFWQSDPTGRTELLAETNWPRDGAMISGEEIIFDNRKYLKVHRVKQAGGHWIDAPDGAYLPFDYDNHYYLEKVECCYR